MDSQFIKPRYDSGGFAGLPDRIINAFASNQYDAVVLFLIDGFGWRFFERFQDAPFFKRIAKHGQIEKLTSQFPSTTAAHLTTIHTGFSVGQSGIYEWYYYEPLVDQIIAPLLFSFSGTRERDTLKQAKVDPWTLYPRTVFYPKLRSMGVEPYVFGPRDYTPSTFSNVVMAGAEMRRYNTLSEVLVNIGALLENQKSPTFVHFYFDKIDSVCHEYGPNAPQTEREMESFLLIMEHYFEQVFGGEKRILFLMTADHGQVEVNPKTTTYLNTDKRFAGIERFIRRNRNDQLLVPAGSARDMFLHINDEMLEEAQAFLTSRLEGKADVVQTESLIAEGYFGAVSARFRERVANLVVLPYRYEAVWWYEKDRFEQRFLGHHGGLTPQELETVLYSCDVQG